MPITHLTGTPVFQTGTGNRTVTTNASTAVGDLMVLVDGFQDSSATTITTPTGWIVQKNAVLTGTLKSSLFTRVRQSGDTTWTYAPNQAVETSHIVLSVSGVDTAGVTFGADGTRAASGGTTGTTAPSVTTTVPGSRVYILSTERTTANETVEATVNNGFTKILHTYLNGSSAESIFLAYKDMPTPGAVGATTVTFQNSQGTNGYATLMVVAPSAAAVDITGTVTVLSASSATLTARRPISGTSNALAGSVGSFSARLDITGAATATTTTAATLTIARAIGGVVDAQSMADATLTATIGISGTATATSAVTGAFDATRAPIAITGQVNATTSVVGTLTTGLAIDGRTDSATSIAGTLSIGVSIVGIITATSTTSGDITVGDPIPAPNFPDTLTLTVTTPTLTLSVDTGELELTATVPTLTLEATW